MEFNADVEQWPAFLDFSLFPNETISGLTLPEINAHLQESISTPQTMITDVSSEIFQENTSSSPQRFAQALSDDELQKLRDSCVPDGTKNRNKWAIGLYEKWQNKRRITDQDNAMLSIPTKSEILTATEEQLDYWFAKFICEVRKMNGEMYPRDTLIGIVAGINAHCSANGRQLNLFTDKRFDFFRSNLDAACIQSSRSGASCSRKQADVISEEEEELLWSKGALGGDNPTALIHTLLYLNGLHFALRSGKEHRDLSIEQITVIPPSSTQEHYVIKYKEKTSKTNNGGLKHRKVEPKEVTHIDIHSIENPERSHALLFQKYLKLRPINSTNHFYLSPLKNWNLTNWYKNVPIGHNTLAHVVRDICKQCDIKGNKTNHSLRATCATRLFNNGVDEQLIMERTGHRSVNGVRTYKRSDSTHHYNTSVIIDNKSIQSIKKTEQSHTFNFIFNDGCTVTINNNQK